MQEPETRAKLLNLLLDIAEGERQIEVLRQVLCEQEDFEPYAAFRRIDRSRRNAITIADILQYLSDNNVTHTEDYCGLFLRRYDLDCDGALGYSEFLTIVLPASNPPLRAVATQRPNYEVNENEYLSYEVEYALAKLLDKEISFYSRLDIQKITLTCSADFSNLEAFSLIDMNRSGRLSFVNLKSFFNSEGVYPGDDEIILMLRRLDKDGDGLVPLEEFIEAIQPLEFVQKASADAQKNLNISSYISRKLNRRVQSEMQANAEAQIGKLYQSLHILSSPQNEKNLAARVVASEKKATTRTSNREERRDTKKNEPSAGKDEESSESQLIMSRYSELTSPGQYGRIESSYKSPLLSSEKSKSNRKYDKPMKEADIDLEDRKEDKYLKKSDLKSYKSRISPSEVSSYNTNEKYSDERYSATKTLSQRLEGRRYSSLTEENQKAVLEILRNFVFLDKEIDTVKRELALQVDFDVFHLFKIFDKNGIRKVTSNEVQEGMQKFGIYPDKEELYLFMRRFDRKNLEELKFGDFIEAVQSLETDLYNLPSRKGSKSSLTKLDQSQLFSEETRKLIGKVLRLHLENEKAAELLRQDLQNKVGFNSRTAFNSLDKEGYGFLTAEKIKGGFAEQGNFLSKKEIQFIMNRLDHEGKGRISYVDFVQEITPKNSQ